jgi:hypothetical protein
MRTTVKLGLTALIAAFLLSSAISTASARSLSVSKEDIRATWNALRFEGGLGIPITCQFTMEGSFHWRTIAKVLGALRGVITRATIRTESCTNARVTVSGLPWHITYEGFTGALPNITGVLVLIRKLRFRLERLASFSSECAYGSAEDRLLGTAAVSSGTITNLRPQTGNRSTLIERRNDGAGLCPASGELANGGVEEGQITLLGGTQRTTITLI